MMLLLPWSASQLINVVRAATKLAMAIRQAMHVSSREILTVLCDSEVFELLTSELLAAEQ